MPKKAIIIGAGIAGIAAAIRLAIRGFEVEVLEANSYPGGKLGEIEINGSVLMPAQVCLRCRNMWTNFLNWPVKIRAITSIIKNSTWFANTFIPTEAN